MVGSWTHGCQQPLVGSTGSMSFQVLGNIWVDLLRGGRRLSNLTFAMFRSSEIDKA